MNAPNRWNSTPCCQLKQHQVLGGSHPTSVTVLKCSQCVYKTLCCSTDHLKQVPAAVDAISCQGLLTVLDHLLQARSPHRSPQPIDFSSTLHQVARDANQISGYVAIDATFVRLKDFILVCNRTAPSHPDLTESTLNHSNPSPTNFRTNSTLRSCVTVPN